jgi:hypothetical protein
MIDIEAINILVENSTMNCEWFIHQSMKYVHL